MNCLQCLETLGRQLTKPSAQSGAGHLLRPPGCEGTKPEALELLSQQAEPRPCNLAKLLWALRGRNLNLCDVAWD